MFFAFKKGGICLQWGVKYTEEVLEVIGVEEPQTAVKEPDVNFTDFAALFPGGELRFRHVDVFPSL